MLPSILKIGWLVYSLVLGVRRCWIKHGREWHRLPMEVYETFSKGPLFESLRVLMGVHCWHWVVFPPEKPISRHVL